ncbi:MAG: hypothetical protein J7M12_01555, partial [Candidatus Hydrogenedentes bacterium]|nr:hypothetical protein [Candidatus Hydrogenedentota bacterium]
ATSISSTLNWTLLLVVLRRTVGPLGTKKLARQAFLTVCAAAAATGVGWSVLFAVRAATGGAYPASIFVKLIHVVLPLATTGTVYITLSYAFRISALRDMQVAFIGKTGST